MGLWGTFDVENYGDHLFPRIAAHELGRRIEGVEIRLFSPYGWLHPTRLDEGRPVEPALSDSASPAVYSLLGGLIFPEMI